MWPDQSAVPALPAVSAAWLNSVCGLVRTETSGGMSRKALRDDWTAYAEENGLIVGGDVSQPRSPKYGNRKTLVDGYIFDSKKEAQRYQELKFMQQAGQISELELQPVFPLHVMQLFRSEPPIQITTVGVFTADFRYVDLNSGEIVVEDVKSEITKNTAYKLRKRIAEAVHGIHVREL